MLGIYLSKHETSFYLLSISLVLTELLMLFCYRVLLCLKRALRIANAAQQMASITRGSSGPVTLFVEILNKSVILVLHLIEPQTHKHMLIVVIVVIIVECKSNS